MLRLNKVDCLLAALAVVYCISSAVNAREVSAAALQGTLPYVLLYCFVRILAGYGREWTAFGLTAAFSVWLCFESVFGLQQVFGHRISGHSAFGMTGSFANPGPFGGFVAILLSPVTVFFIKNVRHLSCLSSGTLWRLFRVRLPGLYKGLYIKWILVRLVPVLLAGTALFLGLTVLPASASRAGWLAFALSLLLYMAVETDWVRKLMRHRIILISAVVFALSVSAGIFLMKKDSALGRLHIWNMEIRAIAASPLAGTGPGTTLGTYGKVQEEYFRDGNRSESVIRVAGAPEYAFNEYLKAGMEAGIPGMLLVSAVAAVSVSALLKRKSPLAYGMSAAAVFSFFSYPLNVPAIAAVVTILLAVSASSGDRDGGRCRPAVTMISVAGISVLSFIVYEQHSGQKETDRLWQSARQMSAFEAYGEAAEEMEALYPEMYWNYRYLYDYGYALHKAGRYEESNEVLTEGAEISSDPMFHNIMGKNFSALGQHGLAESEYLKAHYMVPCRLYPLVLLLTCTSRRGSAGKRRRSGRRYSPCR